MNIDSKNNSLLKNISWNSAGTMTYLFCQWLTTVLVVRLSSGYEEAGNLALAMSVTTVFFCIAIFSMRTFQVSDISNEYETETYISSRILSCVVAFALCTVFLFFNSYTTEQKLVITFYMTFKLSEALVDVFHGIDQRAFRMDIIGKSFIVRGLCLLASFAILQYYCGLLVAILGMTICVFGIIVFYDIPASKKICKYKIRINSSGTYSLLKKCIPLVIVSVFSNVIIVFPRYLIEKLIGNEQLGIYATIATPTLIMQVAAMFIFSPFISYLAQFYNNNNVVKYKKMFLYCIFAITGIASLSLIIVIFWGEWGLVLLFGEGIRKYSYLLFNAVLCTGLTALIWFMTAILTIMRKIKELFIGNMAGAIMCICISKYFILNYQLQGVNYILILSQTVAIAILFICFITGFYKWSLQSKAKQV